MRETRIPLYDHEIGNPTMGLNTQREDVWKKQETHTWLVNNSNSYEHNIILTHPTVLAELLNHPTSFGALPPLLIPDVLRNLSYPLMNADMTSTLK